MKLGVRWSCWVWGRLFKCTFVSETEENTLGGSQGLRGWVNVKAVSAGWCGTGMAHARHMPGCSQQGCHTWQPAAPHA